MTLNDYRLNLQNNVQILFKQEIRDSLSLVPTILRYKQKKIFFLGITEKRL